MGLIEQGHRYYSRPDRKEAEWMHPVEKRHLRPDWIDVTGLTADELVAFFLFQDKPPPHGRTACAAAQLDIFNDTKEPAA